MVKKIVQIVAVTVVVLLAVFYVAGKYGGSAGKTFALVTEQKGGAWVVRADETVPVARGAAVNEGEKIKTGADGTLTFVIADAVVGRLENDTEVEVADINGGRIELKRNAGVLWLSFHKTNAADSLRVISDGATISVVGTDFVVTPAAVLTGSGAVDVNGKKVDADTKLELATGAVKDVSAGEQAYLIEGMDRSSEQLKKIRMDIVRRNLSLFERIKDKLGLAGAAPTLFAYEVYFDNVDNGTGDIAALENLVSDKDVVSRLKSITGEIQKKNGIVVKKGYAPGFTVTRAISPPPPSMRGESVKFEAQDKVYAAMLALGIDTAAFAKDGDTFHVYYEQTPVTSVSELAESLSGIFVILGTIDQRSASFAITPYGVGSDKPFVTFIASADNVREYIDDKITSGEFLKRLTTKEDIAASCKNAYTNAHADKAAGNCACDDGYAADQNRQFGDWQCVKVAALKKDNLPPPSVTAKNPKIQPPTTPTPTPVKADPEKKEPEAVQSGTLKGGRTTLKAPTPADYLRAWTFDNGLKTWGSEAAYNDPHSGYHDKDEDLSFNYNPEDTRNSSRFDAHGPSSKWQRTDEAFDKMVLAPEGDYCSGDSGTDASGNKMQPVCGASLSPEVGKNYYLKSTTYGGRFGTDVIVRYAKIHIVNIVPRDSVTFDWVFQTKEGERGLK